MLLKGKRALFSNSSNVSNFEVVLYWIAVACWHAFGRLVCVIEELLTTLWTLKVWERGVQNGLADYFRAYLSDSRKRCDQREMRRLYPARACLECKVPVPLQQEAFNMQTSARAGTSQGACNSITIITNMEESAVSCNAIFA